MAVELSGNALVVTNEVALRRARLVPAWVTMCIRGVFATVCATQIHV